MDRIFAHERRSTKSHEKSRKPKTLFLIHETLPRCLVCPVDWIFPNEIILISSTKGNSQFDCVMKELSHVDEHSRVRMVDTSVKTISLRRAVASARVLMSPDTLAALESRRTPKGDPLEAARIAGIMAAKKTAELIPLCHPLPLTHIDVRASVNDDGVRLEAEVATHAQTGVEMEALTAVSVAALTVYDMCKALDKGIRIVEVRLESKTGGKSGDYQREDFDS